jgi:hypothetical protein
MEPNYEYRFDKNGVPIAVISAFGKTLSEDLPLDKMVTINETVSEAAATFVEDCRKANIKLRKAEPTNAVAKEYAQAFLAYHLHIHQQETGESVTVVTPGKISEHWEAKENGEEVLTKAEKARSEHKTLADKYNAYEGALSEDDMNRAFLIMACENYVLTKLKEVGSRSGLKCTPADLWTYAIDNIPFVESEWEELLLPTLVQDGWVLFTDAKGGTCILPYGSGIPGYDPKMGVDHPAWARDPTVIWP